MEKVFSKNRSQEKSKSIRQLHLSLLVTLTTIAILYIGIVAWYVIVEEMDFSALLGLGLFLIISGMLFPAIQLGAISKELKHGNQDREA